MGIKSKVPDFEGLKIQSPQFLVLDRNTRLAFFYANVTGNKFKV
jgi:hypothetical protein